MGRAAKLWYRKDRDAWYVNVQGKRIKLVDGKGNRNEAYRRFLALKPDTDNVATVRVTGQEVCSLFLDHAKLDLKPKTYRWYKMILDRFAVQVRATDGNAVTPKEVTRFIAANPQWGTTSRCGVITAVKRAWKWAKDEGHITIDDLGKMKKPRPQRREEIPDDQEIARFLDNAKPHFRELLDFLYATGCRPGEASMIERRHVDLNNKEVRFRIGEDKTSGKTGKPRVIHLNEQAHAILKKLVSGPVTGPVFRNSRGNPWTEHSIAIAARKTRERAGLDSRAVTYALRHHWATDALARGVPLATVAEMMGNSPEIVARVYSHLSDKKSLLLKAANQVRPPVADLSQ